MTGPEIVARARSAIGGKCIYALGKGDAKPLAPVPWGDDRECDCSGFACWCLGISRLYAGRWLGTDEITAEAQLPGHIFEAIPREQAEPGDLIVFPRRSAGHHGHIGVVATTDHSGPLTAVHCSLGNWTHAADAIQETDCAVFWLNGALVARFIPPPGLA